jgi:hypothetical protein
MNMTWDIYFLVLLALAAGYAMGLGSRFVVKAALKDYIEDRMTNLHSVTSSYTQKTQIQCDAMLEQANQEAIKIYKTALKDASGIHFELEDKTLN